QHFGTGTKFLDSLGVDKIISPAQITADQNDYNPTGLATAGVLRLTTDALRNLTGLQAGIPGQVLLIHNVGAFDLVLNAQNAGSVATNRFALFGDLTLSADQFGILWYDGTSTRWRGLPQGGGDIYNTIIKYINDTITYQTN